MENSSKTSSLCGKKLKNTKLNDSTSSLTSGGRDNPLLLKQSTLRIGEYNK